MLAIGPNYTYAQLQQELDDALYSDKYTNLLTARHANMTEQNWTATVLAQSRRGLASLTGKPTGTAASSVTGSAATTTSCNSTRRG